MRSLTKCIEYISKIFTPQGRSRSGAGQGKTRPFSTSRVVPIRANLSGAVDLRSDFRCLSGDPVRILHATLTWEPPGDSDGEVEADEAEYR